MPHQGNGDRPSRDATVTVTGDRAAVAGPVPPPGAGPSSGGELIPGQLVGERYRIVSLLGRGGMGEVYRADDLELGTPVALKFLHAELEGDPVRLERLRREVRLARQVSHPNVCRVFDIGRGEGRSFLAMELVDGEDLASLLRRIGRLPQDKAVELAREICAGLAAAHERDVLHCDLKPANIMVDGRGRARLTDFGLAAAAHPPRDGPDALAGTPAYMAPEQLQGRTATRRSDLYALGLVLYELFTGRPAHAASTLAQLRELRGSSNPPASPSELVQDLDPAVDRAIMGCLEPDPDERPPSALAVLAALPGRDPLQALLEAGETPSPELVAASGRRGSLTPRRALLLAAVIVSGLLLGVCTPRDGSLDAMLGGILPPQVLEHRAREILAAAGCLDPPGDVALGFDLDPGTLARLQGRTAQERRTLLRSEERPVLRFWYRQSATPLSAWRASLPGGAVGNVVTPCDPPLTEPGMAIVRLGPRGRLLELRVVPDEPGTESSDREANPALLDPLLAAAGLPPAEARVVPSRRGSPMPGTWRRTWSLPRSEDDGGALEAEVTYAAGRPTWFRAASTAEWDDGPRGGDPGDLASRVGGLSAFAFLVAGAVVALLNVRSGRWDRRGAARLAIAVLVLCFASVLIGAHHPAEAAAEARLVFSAVAYGASRGLLTWLLYVAIEPFIRKLHPTSLVSWSRLLAGRVRDPAVGRDLLVGLATTSVLCIGVTAWMWARGWVGATLPVQPLEEPGNPLAAATVLAAMVRAPAVALGLSLGFLLIHVIARGALRRARAAAPALLWMVILLFCLGAVESDLPFADRLAITAVVATGYAVLSVRSGLLAFVACAATLDMVIQTIISSFHPSPWYAAGALVFAGAVLVLTAFGVRSSTAGAPLLAPSGREA
jgi:serine/threonine-protein kinase